MNNYFINQFKAGKNPNGTQHEEEREKEEKKERRGRKREKIKINYLSKNCFKSISNQNFLFTYK